MPQGPAIHPPEDNPGFLIAIVMMRLKTGLARRFRAHGFDLTPAHWGVLNRLNHGEGIHQTDLAQELGKDRPNLTRIIDVLEREDLVRREEDPEDRRSHQIYLTPAGRRIVQVLSPEVQSYFDEIFADISPTRYRGFINVLRQLAESLDAKLAEAPTDTSAGDHH